MNILYITKLSGNMWAGPNNSVPKQIAAQAKIDNVLWYNINKVQKEDWIQKSYYKNLIDLPNEKISDLPSPFNNPDLIIFEGVYEFPFKKIIYETWKRKTPYIIVPRSALTQKAQENSALKKKIGNILFFNKFIKRSIAIHYLTKNELFDSQKRWKVNHFIVPNGVENKKVYKVNNNSEELNGIYIGRIDIYQKGLDILIEACGIVQEDLRSAKCKLNLYGPDRNNSRAKLVDLINRNNISDIVSINEGVFDKEKEKIQVNADFFIMTSRFEGHPMGLIEALSYGLPSLVTQGTNMQEEVLSADAGWGSEFDACSLAECLKIIIKEKKYISNKGKNALNLSLNYNWDSLAEISKNQYKEILKQ